MFPALSSGWAILRFVLKLGSFIRGVTGKIVTPQKLRENITREKGGKTYHLWQARGKSRDANKDSCRNMKTTLPWERLSYESITSIPLLLWVVLNAFLTGGRQMCCNPGLTVIIFSYFRYFPSLSRILAAHQNPH